MLHLTKGLPIKTSSNLDPSISFGVFISLNYIPKWSIKTKMEFPLVVIVQFNRLENVNLKLTSK